MNTLFSPTRTGFFLKTSLIGIFCLVSLLPAQGMSAASVVNTSVVTVDDDSAVVSLTVNKTQDSVKLWVEYGATSSLGKKTTQFNSNSESSSVTLERRITRLEPNTTYYYRGVADENGQVSLGPVSSFKTTSVPGKSSTTTVSGSSSNSSADDEDDSDDSSSSSSSSSGSNSNNSSERRSFWSAIFGSDDDTQTGNSDLFGDDADDSADPDSVAGTANSGIALEVVAVNNNFDSNSSVMTIVEGDGDSDAGTEVGDDFAWTVIYENTSSSPLSDANLKITIPIDVELISVSKTPTRTEGGVLFYDLGVLSPEAQESITIRVRIKDAAKPGTTLVFSTVFQYKDSDNQTQSVTSYLTALIKGSTAVKVERSSLFASLMGLFSGLWLLVLFLFISAGYLLYRYRRNAGMVEAGPGPSYRAPILPVTPPAPPLKRVELPISNLPVEGMNLPGFPALGEPEISQPTQLQDSFKGTSSFTKAVLGFSFGHRGQEPGLSNEYLAQAIKDQYPDALVVVQWEIGAALNKIGVHPYHEIREHFKKKGAYLDTDEVARQMAEILQNHPEISEVYAIAQDDHMPRVLKTLSRFGINAKWGSFNIPYDPFSHQIWTRSRALFTLREILALPIYMLKGAV